MLDATGSDNDTIRFSVPVDYQLDSVVFWYEVLSHSDATEQVQDQRGIDGVSDSSTVDSYVAIEMLRDPVAPQTSSLFEEALPAPPGDYILIASAGAGGSGGCCQATWTYRVELVVVPLPTGVEIDVMPGSENNCVNMDGRGVIPVAILGSNALDVTLIAVETLVLDGLYVRRRGLSRPQCSLQDVNADHVWDLVCQFEDSRDRWVPDSGLARLTGQQFDGSAFEGTDSICMVPKGPNGSRKR